MRSATTATWVGWLVLVSALTTVAVTAAYSARLLLMTFGGDYRGTGVPHEAPALMRWPLVVLAVPAAGLGVLALSADWLPTWLGPVGPTTALTPNLATAALALLLVVLGAGAAWLRWRPAPDADPVAGLGRLRPALESGFGVDAVYERVLIRPLRVLAKAVVLADNELVSGAVQGSGGVTVRAAFGLRRLQSGNAQSYLTGALAGVSVLLVVAVMVMWA